MNKKRIFLGAILVTSILSSCAFPPNENFSSQVPSFSLSPSATSTPALSVPTITPAYTDVPTKLSPTSTLTSDEKEKRFLAMLQSSEPTCQLPCWWNINPKKTTWAEAKDIITQLGSRVSNIGPDSDGVTFHGLGGLDLMKFNIRNNIGFSERSGTIESINIDSSSQDDPLSFREVWQNYFPKQVIATFGQPSRIWLQTACCFREPNVGKTMPYFLWLFYDNRGFLIRYTGAVKYQAVYKICPEAQNKDEGLRGIYLYIQSPESQNSLEQAGGRPISAERQFIKTIKEASNIGVEDFYNLFTQSDKMACFETPQNIWP